METQAESLRRAKAKIELFHVLDLGTEIKDLPMLAKVFEWAAVGAELTEKAKKEARLPRPGTACLMGFWLGVVVHTVAVHFFGG